MKEGTEAEIEDVWIKSICYMCQCNDTGIRAHRVNGTLVRIEGDPECPPNYGRQCAKGLSAVMMPYNPRRVLKPLKRTNPEKGLGIDPKWVEITWEEAMDTIVERMKKIREDNPLKLLLSAFDYPNYLHVAPWLIAFGGQFYFGGSTWCGWYHNSCYQFLASFFREADYDHCNYMMVWGAQAGNIVDALPVYVAKKMADARSRGMKVVVIDPVCTNIASKADEWIPIRPGTDGALALCMMNVLINELGLYDVEFLKSYSNGPYLVGPDGYYHRDRRTKKPMVWDVKEGKAKPFDAVEAENMALEGEYKVGRKKCFPAFHLFKEHIKQYTPEEVSTITTIPVETIRRIAKEYGEAARIGSTIVLDGVELPLRPACVIDGRGASAHRHAMHTCYSLMLLNVIIGAINVPGGILGISTNYKRRWGPKVDSDGFLLSNNWYFNFGCLDPYPPRKVVPPKLYNLLELLPVTSYSDNFVPFVMQNPRLFKIPYDIEMMMICFTNPIMAYINPEEMISVLKKIPFILGFAIEMNEAMEMCDIVLPQAHWLERYDPIANPPFKFEAVGRHDWYWYFRRPVLKPPPGVKHWVEILYELAERVGFLKEFYETINWYNQLRDPHKLDPNKKHSYLEVSDRIMKDRYGVGVEWYEKNQTQFYTQPKDVEEAYPMIFTGGRVPIYMEFWKRAGEDVKKVAKEIGIEDVWDTDDYTPLLTWWPCPSFEQKGEYDLFVVNYKVPYHTMSMSLNNPILHEMGRTYPWVYGIQINRETAKRKGIKDGDEIWVEGESGYRVKGRAVLTECIHHECVGIAGTFGKRALGEEVAKGTGANWNTLISQRYLDRFDKMSCSLDSCMRVKVYKA